MSRFIGSPVTVRRTWRTTLLGTAVGGTASFVVATPDPADPAALLYWNGSDTGVAATDLQAAPVAFPMTQTGGVGPFQGGYVVPKVLSAREIQEIASHSVYGDLSQNYRGEVLPSARFG